MISGDHSWKTLDGQALRGRHLRGSVFVGSSMVGCDLCDADLREVVFHLTDLSGAVLSSAQTKDADWYGCFFDEQSQLPPEGVPRADNFFSDYDHWRALRDLASGITKALVTKEEALEVSASWTNATSSKRP